MDTSILRENIQSLVEKFDRDKHHYLSKDYLEAQCRQDFIDPLFEALGWDISNKAGLPPFEREVLLEKGETSGRPDYNFRLGGASKFFVEAKAPPESLDSVRHVLQAKSYAWNTKEVFLAVLTDFEGLKVFDASLTPDRKNPLQGLIIDLKYTEYLNNLDKLLLLSREAVSQGSLERLLLRDAKSKRQRIPVDKKFLQDMGLWREGLAKDVYRHDPSISVRTLNEVVQRLLDRIVFIRIAEDRKIIEPRTLFEIAQLWKAEGKKRPIQYHLNNLFREINADLNGDIFKSPHPCEQYEIDSSLLSEIIEDLYFPNSPYLFDVIGVELLGSIYERYLGNTIRATPGGRVKVEEKPEVRKAGGVYYTPQYIVKYIVENTVGRLIEGKTPKQIEKIKVLDPACGSGSFLLGAFQYLIDYHIKYYREHPKEAHVHPLFPDLIGDPEGRGDPPARPYRLSIIKKGHILRNNLFGVDIDPQAVEITMMSLYLKALEGERTLPRKQGLLPVLSDNIKCGNSLIGYDIFDVSVGATHRVAPTKGQGILVGAGLPRPYITDEERERINPFDWNSKSAGFGEIMGRGGFDCVMGNPPWGGDIDDFLQYFEMKFPNSTREHKDTFKLFIEKGVTLLKNYGVTALIVPSALLFQPRMKDIRVFMSSFLIEQVVILGENIFETGVAPSCIFILTKRKGKSKVSSVLDISDSRNNEERELLLKNPDFTKVRQELFKKNPDCSFLASPVVKHRGILPLGKLLEVKDAGINYQRVGVGLKEKGKSDLSSRLLYEDNQQRKIDKMYWKGEDINRYFSRETTERFCRPDYYRFIKKNEVVHLNEEVFGFVPKILIRQTADRIIGTLDSKGLWFGRSIIAILFEKPGDYNIKYILALLNSTYMKWFYQKLVKEKGRVFPQVKLQKVKQLPIRTINFDNPKEKAAHDRLVTLVDRMLELNKKRHALPVSSQQEAVGREIAVTDEKIDDLVYELYGITKGERKIIEGMG